MVARRWAQVRDRSTLRALAVHLMTQPASLVLFLRIARTLDVSLDRARAYCSHLREAFLLGPSFLL